jgi:hypothetical protein
MYRYSNMYVYTFRLFFRVKIHLISVDRLEEVVITREEDTGGLRGVQELKLLNGHGGGVRRAATGPHFSSTRQA